MKKSIQLNHSERGFTLLEVIVTIVIAAILGSLLFTFMGTGITKSAVPVNQTRQLGNAIGCIEMITADYALYMRNVTGHEWSNLTALCTTGACAGIGSPSETTIPAATINGININHFQMLQVTASDGDQKIISYFTERKN